MDSLVSDEKIRFLDKTKENGDCWDWTGGHARFGYGKLKRNGHYLVAHRVSYELFKGPIPDGLCVRHTCDRPGCVNPEHLVVGTQADNMRDMRERGRANYFGGKFCRRGRQTPWNGARKGENNPCARITEAMARDIKARLRDGHGTTAIARELGLAIPTVSSIKHGRTWAHVEVAG